MLGGTIRCEICGLGGISPSFRREENIRPLYWANPALVKGLDSPKYFCGPAHSTEWFVNRIKETRASSQDGTLPQGN